ncbi:Phage major capsid protein, P2 family, partial [Haemophilus influenzae]
GRRYRH